MENNDELKEFENIQNLFDNANVSKPFYEKGRFSCYFFAENKFKKPFRDFKILPAFGFIIDSQFKDGFPNKLKGCIEYTIYFDIFAWSFILSLNVENKELTTEE